MHAELLADVTEFGALLGGDEEGDGVDVAEAEEFLGRVEEVGEGVDGLAEFVLDVAEAARRTVLMEGRCGLGWLVVSAVGRTRRLGSLIWEVSRVFGCVGVHAGCTYGSGGRRRVT